jgi:hypothetical protein
MESPKATTPAGAGLAWTSTSSRKYQLWLVVVNAVADSLPAWSPAET